MTRRALIAIAVLAYLCGVAFGAADPPPPDADSAAWIQAIYVAVTSKNWGIVVGLALIALVFPLRAYGPALFKSKAGGLLLAFVTSLAGTLGAAFAAGAKPDLPMIVTALTTAATGAGLWAWLKDYIPKVRAASDKIATEAPVSPPKARYTPLFVVVALGIGGASQVSCATPAVVTGGAVVIDCLVQDQAQLVDLVGSLWAVFTSGGSWKDVKDSAVTAGKDLGGCALAEVVQKYLSPPKGRRAPPAEQGQAARAALEEFRSHNAGGATFKTAAGYL